MPPAGIFCSKLRSRLSSRAAAPAPTHPAAPPPPTPRPHPTHQIQAMQQDLAEVSVSPLLGLTQAAEAMASHLKADLVA